jgi:hypothetical protein
MKFTRLLLPVFAILVAFCSGPLRADIITTGVLPINVSGQNSIVNVTAPNLWDSGTGLLTFRGVGDFDDLQGERADLYLNSIFIGTAGRGLPGSVFTLGSQPGMMGLHQLTASFVVSAANMQSILGTSTNVAMRIDLTPGVGGNTSFAGDSIQSSLTYTGISAVPEPSTLLLGSVAVAAFGFVKRRKNKRTSLAPTAI